jgi:hypothetical protein
MPFYLKLKGKKEENDEEIAKRFAKAAAKRQLKERQLINDWINQNSEFDKEKYINIWEDYRKEYGNKFIEECLRIYAIANSAVDVNIMLNQNMGMTEAGIDIATFNGLLGKVFIINLVNALLEKFNLEGRAKEELMIRVIAREFPSRENKPSLPQTFIDLNDNNSNKPPNFNVGRRTKRHRNLN